MPGEPPVSGADDTPAEPGTAPGPGPEPAPEPEPELEPEPEAPRGPRYDSRRGFVYDQ